MTFIEKVKSFFGSSRNTHGNTTKQNAYLCGRAFLMGILSLLGGVVLLFHLLADWAINLAKKLKDNE